MTEEEFSKIEKAYDDAMVARFGVAYLIGKLEVLIRLTRPAQERRYSDRRARR